MELVELLQSPEPLEPETLSQLFPELDLMDREIALVTKVILGTNFVFEHMDVFENAVTVLNNISPDVNKTEGIRPEWIWKALPVIVRLRPGMEFSNEVIKYIKWIFTDNGIKFMPPVTLIPGAEGSDVTTDFYNKIVELSKQRNIPETPEGIQAYHYLRILEYIRN